MSVLLETSVGDITVDLFTDDCPKACENFLKLCKIKYYNGVTFHNIQHNMMAQSGDPTGTGKGGESIYSLLHAQAATTEEERQQEVFFDDEIYPHLRHTKKGTLSMANRGKNLNGSQFFITTIADVRGLDGQHTVFGMVAEGLEVLDTLNDTLVDGAGRPLQNIRIKHTYVLDDPFPDPPGLDALIPPESPLCLRGGEDRMEIDEPLDEEDGDNGEEEDPEKAKEKKERVLEAQERTNTYMLEMAQDLPYAEFKPEENILFVCKLNPATEDNDLALVFSRFGKVLSAEIIRDRITGDSLCFGFVEFERVQDAREAFVKMDGVLLDDRRIKVDFSQSAGKQKYISNFKNRAGKWIPVGKALAEQNALADEAAASWNRVSAAAAKYEMIHGDDGDDGSDGDSSVDKDGKKDKKDKKDKRDRNKSRSRSKSRRDRSRSKSRRDRSKSPSKHHRNHSHHRHYHDDDDDDHYSSRSSRNDRHDNSRSSDRHSSDRHYSSHSHHHHHHHHHHHDHHDYEDRK